MSLINPKYKFPEYFSWPFFFTIQKDGETRRKQLTMWSDLTVKFCQDNKVWKLDKTIFFENLGKNPKVNRKLNTNSIDIKTLNQFVLTFLESIIYSELEENRKKVIAPIR